MSIPPKKKEEESPANSDGHEIVEENEKTTAFGGLSDYLTKNLLRDLELSGETRESFDLLEFCNNNSDIYGPKGSLLRR
jgi:hypothetical protein